MGYSGWKPYVPVAARRTQADTAVRKAKRGGHDLSPVVLASSTIARTFWGKAWCDNLERYSDFENRLPRGRSYVRSGAVIDLRIEPGKVVALVAGSTLYEVEIGIEALPARAWKKLVGDCAGSVATLVELLQGRFSKAVMARLCEPRTGLFPAPKEIRFGCSCPDWASMCKHVAAVLYGVGARLDDHPELLFVLRQVDASDLLTAQAAVLPAPGARKPAKSRILDDAALADVFGIELAADAAPAAKASEKRRAPASARSATDSGPKTDPAASAQPADSGGRVRRARRSSVDGGR